MKRLMASIGMIWCLAGSSQAGQVACMGQLVPGEKVVRIAAPVGSIVGELPVQRGDRVEKGAVLAVLRDEPLYRAQWARSKQQVEVARAELKLAVAAERPELLEAQEAVIAASAVELRLLEGRLARHDELEKGRHVSQDDYDDLAGRVEALRARNRRERSVLAAMRTARVEEAGRVEAGVRLAEAQEAEALAMLALQSIRAPMKAEVLDIHAWPGEGILDGGAVVSLGDTGNMMVLAEVYETDLGKVKTGQKATFRGQAFAGEGTGVVVEVQRLMEGGRVFPMGPSEYVDRRIAVVRIRPDDPAALAAFSHAHVTVTIQVP